MAVFRLQYFILFAPTFINRLLQSTETVLLWNRKFRGYFFPNELIFDRPISSNSITNAFHRSWDHLVEAKQANAPKARIHDLRHAAALDIIRNWVSVGKNLNALYPYLSSYLGHVSYTETDYYVHLSTDFYSDIESKMQGVNDYLYGDDDDE